MQESFYPGNSPAARTAPGGLPAGGEWRCMFVDEITPVVITPGEWHSGRDHRWDQTYMEKVDVDVGKP